ncbi:CRISPR-associated endonuclease Cas3'' [Streptomyces sp. fd1-xmd]|uniref:CRISPR-associated endonuclease Cas3'' n=1 Tax=Streptomyces sp. fd1-xmd TaxID=1812480 RepID=UPI001CECE5EB|nr:CRISPR-associated endonuclease Cas3'' [Streptomyces sp. fd1-xmd]
MTWHVGQSSCLCAAGFRGGVLGVTEDGRRSGGLDLTPWGKFDRGEMAVYALLFHLLDVAAVAGVVWDRVLSPAQRLLIARGMGVNLSEARCLVMFFCALHDLGKASWFQQQEPHPWARVSDALRDDARGWRRMRHERASMHAVLQLLAEAGYRADRSDSPGVRVAQIVGGHHGRFLQLDLDGAARLERTQVVMGGARWQDLRRRYFTLIRHLTGAEAVPQQVTVPAAVLVTAVGVIADRLASSRHYWLPKALAPAFGPVEHYAQSCADAVRLVEEAGLRRVVLPAVPFARVHHGATDPNVLQASLITQLPPRAAVKGPGIVVVTDTTGAGKTIAALETARIFNASGDTQGIAWLLPTTATADAAYDTLEKYVAAHHPEHAPVSLVHSHTWANRAYTDHRLADAEGELTCDEHWTGDEPDGAPGPGERPAERVTVPDGWLRGWDRALLAPFTVATHDQALMAALPVRFSALRLLALSGRTVIVDEVHAMTPFMLQILHRLLEWLGALHCPVVLLSATLPGTVTDTLVRHYLTGAGHKRRALPAHSYAPSYPGWSYTAATDASLTRMDLGAVQRHAAEHRRTAHLQLVPVRHASRTGIDTRTGAGTLPAAPADPCAGTGGVPPLVERLEHITRTIAPVAAQGGCAIVACATMDAAQQTYLHLRDHLDWPDEGTLVLLHARLPEQERETLIRRLRKRMGAGRAPGEHLVVVTTSILDMSLDIDVDVMISDLAPLNILLQRLGRLWRFENRWAADPDRRPGWLSGTVPVLHVLEPVDDHRRTRIPAGWRTLHPAHLLHTTADTLRHTGPHGQEITLPDHVQSLIEAFHHRTDGHEDAGEDDGLPASARGSQYQVRRRRQEHHSALHLAPAPRHTMSLSDLHRQDLHARDAVTRLGVMPRRLLPLYRSPRGRLFLDRDLTRPLDLDRKPTTAAARTILQHTLPVPAPWILGGHQHPPAAWKHHALLADVVLLPLDPDDPGTGVRFENHTLNVQPVLGLTSTRHPQP